jgi:hypothetical protein
MDGYSAASSNLIRESSGGESLGYARDVDLMG